MILLILFSFLCNCGKEAAQNVPNRYAKKTSEMSNYEQLLEFIDIGDMVSFKNLSQNIKDPNYVIENRGRDTLTTYAARSNSLIKKSNNGREGQAIVIEVVELLSGKDFYDIDFGMEASCIDILIHAVNEEIENHEKKKEAIIYILNNNKSILVTASVGDDEISDLVKTLEPTSRSRVKYENAFEKMKNEFGSMFFDKKRDTSHLVNLLENTENLYYRDLTTKNTILIEAASLNIPIKALEILLNNDKCLEIINYRNGNKESAVEKISYSPENISKIMLLTEKGAILSEEYLEKAFLYLAKGVDCQFIEESLDLFLIIKNHKSFNVTNLAKILDASLTVWDNEKLIESCELKFKRLLSENNLSIKNVVFEWIKDKKTVKPKYNNNYALVCYLIRNLDANDLNDKIFGNNTTLFGLLIQFLFYTDDHLEINNDTLIGNNRGQKWILDLIEKGADKNVAISNDSKDTILMFLFSFLEDEEFLKYLKVLAPLYNKEEINMKNNDADDLLATILIEGTLGDTEICDDEDIELQMKIIYTTLKAGVNKMTFEDIEIGLILRGWDEDKKYYDNNCNERRLDKDLVMDDGYVIKKGSSIMDMIQNFEASD